MSQPSSSDFVAGGWVLAAVGCLIVGVFLGACVACLRECLRACPFPQLVVPEHGIVDVIEDIIEMDGAIFSSGMKHLFPFPVYLSILFDL